MENNPRKRKRSTAFPRLLKKPEKKTTKTIKNPSQRPTLSKKNPERTEYFGLERCRYCRQRNRRCIVLPHTHPTCRRCYSTEQVYKFHQAQEDNGSISNRAADELENLRSPTEADDFGSEDISDKHDSDIEDADFEALNRTHSQYGVSLSTTWQQVNCRPGSTCRCRNPTEPSDEPESDPEVTTIQTEPLGAESARLLRSRRQIIPSTSSLSASSSSSTPSSTLSQEPHNPNNMNQIAQAKPDMCKQLIDSMRQFLELLRKNVNGLRKELATINRQVEKLHDEKQILETEIKRQRDKNEVLAQEIRKAKKSKQDQKWVEELLKLARRTVRGQDSDQD